MRSLPEEAHFQIARRQMVQQQLAARGIQLQSVLDAMERVPRHLFVGPDYRHRAYDDEPLPVEHGATVSQPLMVALMLQSLQVEPSSRVLEVGTGTGYQAALLAVLAARVITIERIQPLAQVARQNLTLLGLENVEVIAADGSLGYPPQAPYDRIIVAAAAPSVPSALVEQLADGGVLLVPVGPADVQIVHRITRNGDHTRTERLDPCRFVPLIGQQGHPERD